MGDLLCFKVVDKVYGIPLNLVKESFDIQKITPVPRVNQVFTGLCNHKGIIYPVLSFTRLCKEKVLESHSCMLLLHVDKYQFILQVDDIPNIIYKGDIINDTAYEGGSDVIKIDRLCQNKDTHIYVLNMKKTIDILSKNILI